MQPYGNSRMARPDCQGRIRDSGEDDEKNPGSQGFPGISKVRHGPCDPLPARVRQIRGLCRSPFFRLQAAQCVREGCLRPDSCGQPSPSITPEANDGQISDPGSRECD